MMQHAVIRHLSRMVSPLCLYSWCIQKGEWPHFLYNTVQHVTAMILCRQHKESADFITYCTPIRTQCWTKDDRVVGLFLTLNKWCMQACDPCTQSLLWWGFLVNIMTWQCDISRRFSCHHLLPVFMPSWECLIISWGFCCTNDGEFSLLATFVKVFSY